MARRIDFLMRDARSAVVEDRSPRFHALARTVSPDLASSQTALLDMQPCSNGIAHLFTMSVALDDPIVF